MARLLFLKLCQLSDHWFGHVHCTSCEVLINFIQTTLGVWLIPSSVYWGLYGGVIVQHIPFNFKIWLQIISKVIKVRSAKLRGPHSKHEINQKMYVEFW
jgi:hypothetical protein